MRKEDFIKKNPLRVLQPENEDRRVGLIMARAGLGKTAILVQLALDCLMRGKRVLHVSIGQNLDKTRAWYYDIFKDMVEKSELEDAAAIQEDIHRNRLIMTFNEASFSRAKFEERLNDLVSQNIFKPDCLLVDGLDLATVKHDEVAGMRDFVKEQGVQGWFSAVCHREQAGKSPEGTQLPCDELDDIFDTVIMLMKEPKQKCLVLNVVKDDSGITTPGNILHLDPATLMINP